MNRSVQTVFIKANGLTEHVKLLDTPYAQIYKFKVKHHYVIKSSHSYHRTKNTTTNLSVISIYLYQQIKANTRISRIYGTT